MKKKNFLWTILNLIFLVIFNVVFFVLGDSGETHNASVWISYAFIHFAYFMLLLTPMLVKKGKSSHIFGFSIYAISVTYFLLEFVTGITFMLIAPEGYKAALLVQICIAGLYGIILVANMIANEHTAEVEEKRQSEIAYIKDASSKLKILLESISHTDTKKIVERVYDTINSSPVKSNPKAQDIEVCIIEFSNKLESAVRLENNESIISISNNLLDLINKRNNLLQSLN